MTDQETGQEPIVLHMKSWRERNCWARRPWRSGHGSGWNAGTPGHCAAWYCRTPWGAVWGSVKLHQLQGGTLYIDRGTLLSYVLGTTAAVFAIAVIEAFNTSGGAFVASVVTAVASALSCALLGLASSKWAH